MSASAMAQKSKGSFLRTIKAVAWSFVGIRKDSAWQEDQGRITPFHVIAVALVGVAVFVGALVLLVNWVVSK